MKKTLLMFTTLVTAVGLALLVPLPGSGQDAPKGPPGGGKGGGGKGGGGGRGGGAPKQPAGPMPKLPDGHPDMQGFWSPPDHNDNPGIEGRPAAAAGGGGGRAGGGAPGGPGGGGAPAFAGGPPPGGPPQGGAPGGGAPGGGGRGGPGGGGPGGGGAAAAPGACGRGSVVQTPDCLIPYKPEARAKQADIQANHMADEPELHCYQSGIPHSESNRFGMQIVQTPGYWVQMSEFMHTVRIIPTDGRPHIDAKIKLFQGDPVGHWDGDTLVVDTTNQNSKTWFDTAGNFKTENLHITEKFTPQDENTIVYEATMHDPTIYTQDWTAKWNIPRNGQARPDGAGHPYQNMEFACVEGNQDVTHYTEDKGGKAKQVLGAKQ